MDATLFSHVLHIEHRCCLVMNSRERGAHLRHYHSSLVVCRFPLQALGTTVVLTSAQKSYIHFLFLELNP